MTLQKLAALIAKREGKKSQAKIYDIKESLSILFDLMAEEQVEKKSSICLEETNPLSSPLNFSVVLFLRNRCEKLNKKISKTRAKKK